MHHGGRKGGQLAGTPTSQQAPQARGHTLAKVERKKKAGLTPRFQNWSQRTVD
jgi:hypothetical protein